MRTVLAVIAFAFAAGAGAAQPVAPLPPPTPLPPGEAVSNTLLVVGSEPAGLPGGKDVSQPLQPVGPAPAEPKPVAPVELPQIKSVPPEHPRGPLGPGWDDFQLLYWWPTRQPLPPLAYGSRGGRPDQLNALLLGGHAIDSQPSAGGRFTLGWSVNTAETTGLEVTYLFLGTRTFHQNVRSFDGGPAAAFGLPYTNAATGASEILTLARPGFADSALTAYTSVRVQGWEVNSVSNVLDERCVKLNALIGWRYFQVHEGARLEQIRFRNTGPGGVVRTADQFDAHNRFNGGQLGLQADVRRGVVFCEMTAKVAFGQTYEVVKNEGATLFQPFGIGGPVTQAYGGSGLYVQPSNAGRTANGVFAVVPEGTFKFGFRLGDAGRLYVGYSFIYLSDAVRPGDQIDRTLNPSQVPLVSGTAPVLGADRPARLFNRSDFWAQGLIIGLETRY
ncbi:MAG: BBP7 family outer membrane beta-barrel protein [Planctomycetes bacterium]|nr:BBP7 family outer membrane beta-barrel protein [Planctomycetota bacterium]